jgi:hypothetical protein
MLKALRLTQTELCEIMDDKELPHRLVLEISLRVQDIVRVIAQATDAE